MGKLTATAVKNAKPGKHVDGQGLMLHVRDNGARAWVLRVQVHGQRRDFGLGSTLSLSEAREKAGKWRKVAKEGGNPSLEARKVERVVPTFEAAAREYYALKKGGWKNPKHAAQWINTLEAYAFPTLGAMLPDAIDAEDIWAALGPIWQDKQETARRVRQRIATVLDYCKAKKWRTTEAPMRALSKISSEQVGEEKNFAAMPYQQIPDLMARLRERDQTVGRLALQFQILNASRPGEVRGARWGEIDWERREWSVPPSRMKKKNIHIVPLTEASVAILRTMADRFGSDPDALIFPGAKKGKPFSENTLNKVLNDNGGEGFTAHGTARSGFRDWGAEKCPSVPGEAFEKALAHKVRDKTVASYRRTSYLDMRRETIMPAWADYLSGAARNVVKLVGAA